MENGFSWTSMILGILYIILGFFAFSNPISGAAMIIYFIAFLAIAKGIFEVAFRRKMARYSNMNSIGLLVLGAIEIVIGLFLLFNAAFGLLALPIIFAIWFIIDSIGSIFSAFQVKVGWLFWTALILGIIGLLVGIGLLIEPIVGLFTISFLVGFYFLLAGVGLIVQAF